MDMIDRLHAAAFDDMLDDLYAQPAVVGDYDAVLFADPYEFPAEDGQFEEWPPVPLPAQPEPPEPAQPAPPAPPAAPIVEGMYVDGVLVPLDAFAPRTACAVACAVHLKGKGFCPGPQCEGCQPLRGVCRASRA